jgi:hypothetical protein
MLKLLLILWWMVPSEGGAGCTLASGRSIQATSDSGMVLLNATQDSAIVRLGGHKIDVLTTMIRLDDSTRFPIDKSVDAVTLKSQGNRLIFIADGETVATCLR